MDKLKDFIKYFINNILPTLMYDEYELPNIRFYFKEEEARTYIDELLKSYKMDSISSSLNNIDYNYPVIEVSNYKLFFTYLRDLINMYNYEKFNKYQLRSNNISHNSNIYKYIWLRMTPDDFKNPELFLKKSIDMIRNNTFDEYYEEKYINRINIFKDYIIKAKNDFANHFDEESKQMLFFLINKDKKRLLLPVVRYGIYEENNKLVCEIGSIQNVSKSTNKEIEKEINKLKYKINEDVPNDLVNDIEPKKLISLLLFVRMLHEKGINTIKIPSMYVLDYEFHEKANNVIKSLFKDKWSDYQIKRNEELYKKELEEYKNKVDKQDKVSELKTTTYLKMYERLMYHLSDTNIIEYPMELSSYLSFNINSLDNIKGDYVKDIFTKKKIQK